MPMAPKYRIGRLSLHIHLPLIIPRLRRLVIRLGDQKVSEGMEDPAPAAERSLRGQGTEPYTPEILSARRELGSFELLLKRWKAAANPPHRG